MIVALVVFALQQGGEDGGGGLLDGVGAPLNAIAQAAVKTQDQGGGRAVMRGVMTRAGNSEAVRVAGRIEYNDDGLSRGTVTVPDPGSSGPVKLDYVQDGTHMYMRSSRFGTLPDGSSWMGLDLSFGELDSPLPTGGDAKGELELLERATGGVDKVGKETVRGVPTTRYRGKVDPSESAEQWRQAGADKSAAYAEEVGVPLRVEAWIDAKGLVRRMRIVQLKSVEGGDGPASTDMRIDFFDFGYEPEIEVPDSGEVFDATPLAQEQLDASDDQG